MLAPDDRLRLSRLLRDPTDRFPLIPDEVARLPVPTGCTEQVAMLDLLEAGVRRCLDHALDEWTLEQIVPAIAHTEGGIDASPDAPNRLIALLLPHGVRSWSALAACRIDEIRGWRGVGRTLTARVVRCAVAAVLLRLPSNVHPSERASADSREHRTPAEEAFDVALAAITDFRARAVFEQLDLRLDRPSREAGRLTEPRPADNGDRLSAVAVAHLVGLSGERVRQLRVSAREQVARAARDLPAVCEVAGDLAQRIGTAAPREDVDKALATHGLCDVSDPAAMLAVWLAGPYRMVPGHPDWIATDPCELLSSTRSLLAEAGGVHDRRSLESDLSRLGIMPDRTGMWLAAQHVRIEHDVVVDLVGRAAAVAERALEATGRSMSTADLLTWMGDDAAAAALPAELRRDARLIETSPDQWELAEWGGAPSAHIVRLEVAVTPAVLAGETGEAPDDLASLLGLQPRAPKKFPTRFGPLAIVDEGGKVVRGSARPVALACGATVGDTLVFVIDPRSGTAEVEVHTCAALTPPPS